MLETLSLWSLDLYLVYGTIFILTWSLYKSVFTGFVTQGLKIQSNLIYQRDGERILIIGGIPIALAIICEFLYLFASDKLELIFPYHRWMAIKFWLLGLIPILIYGYIDDYIKIKPMVKLAFQLIPSLIFSMGIVQMLVSDYLILIFLSVQLLALCIYNGANLIDGIDTISFKVASVILLAFSYLAFKLQLFYLIKFIGMLYFPFLALYIFNFGHTKIFLGEIGSIILGHIYLFLAELIFVERNMIHAPSFESFLMVCLPVMGIFIEVVVSFCRRILVKSSPFKGDRKHFHHILSEYKNWGHHKAGTFIAGFYFLVMCIAMILMSIFSTGIACIFALFAFATIQWGFCHSVWFPQRK